jgi:hypothetical protein
MQATKTDGILWAIFLTFAESGKTFSADDVRAAAESKLSERVLNKRMPAMFKCFSSRRMKVIATTGGFVLSQRNSGPLPLWIGTKFKNRLNNRVDASGELSPVSDFSERDF